MESLPARLAEHLRARGVAFVTATAEEVASVSEGWRVALRAGAAAPQAIAADAVVIAVPAPEAARLLAAADRALAVELAAIAYAGSAIVSLGFARGDVAHPLDAAGLVVPRREGRRALAVSFSSAKFPGRAPEACALVRVFLGGALDPAVLDLDDAALEALARDEARVLVGATGRPLLSRVDRWGGAMPQYHVGHADRVARIERAVAERPGLALAGAAYRGVGIPQVIASGQAAVALVTAHPRPSTP